MRSEAKRQTKLLLMTSLRSPLQHWRCKDRQRCGHSVELKTTPDSDSDSEESRWAPGLRKAWCTCPSLQAEAKQALKDESDAEDSEEKQSSGDEASDDSGFGLGAGKKKKVPAKRMIKKGGVPMVAPEPGATTGTAPEVPQKPKPATAGKAANTAKKMEALVTSGQSMLASLKQVSMLAVWNTPQKQKELQGKLAKAIDLCSKLDQYHGHVDAEMAKVELESQADAMSTWAELVESLKYDNPSPRALLSRLAEHRSRMSTALAQQSPECVRAVLVDIGRMLSEARFLLG